MFNDYETVYESHFGLFPEVVMGIFIVISLIIIISLVSMAVVYKKAHKPWWSALVPIYNFAVLLELATMPMWYIILLFVPLVNFVVLIIACMNVATAFNKKKSFGVGLFFLPFVFYPILAFSNSEYRGINNSAFDTYSVYPNALVKEISIDEIKQQVEITNQVEITTGKGKKSEYKVPDSLKVSTNNNNPLPPQQEMLADFRVEVPHTTVPKEEVKQEIETKPKEVSSIQDFYSKFKEESKSNEPVNPADFISQMIKSETTVNNNNVPNDVNTDFVTCSKCNAKLKKGATQCFLCGAKIE